MFERYSQLSRQAIFVALREAGQFGTPSICSGHLLIELCKVHLELIEQLGIEMDPKEIRTGSQQWHALSEDHLDSQSLPVADELGAVFGRAETNADLHGCKEIRIEHLPLSLMEVNCPAAQLLTACGSSKELIAAHVANVNCSSAQLGATGSWFLDNT